MGTRVIDSERIAALLGSNQEAKDFLVNYWSPYIHEIDDIIDGDRTSAEDILATFARAALLYSHPFYLKHILELRTIVLMVTNAFADSVAFERGSEDWQKQWADHYRHIGAEMTLAITQICGGYDAMRAISKEIRCVCHYEHHDRNGLAT